MFRTALSILAAFALQSMASAGEDDCADLGAILSQPQFAALTPAQLSESRESANWSDNKRLMTFCYETHCFVVKPCTDDLMTIDITGIVKGNVGKIGWKPVYEKIENRPVFTSENWNDVIAKWHNLTVPSSEPDAEETYGTLLRTRVWIEGQRYTVYEPVLIRNDEPFYR